MLQKMLKIFNVEMSLKFTNLTLWSNLPGSNELICLPSEIDEYFLEYCSLSAHRVVLSHQIAVVLRTNIPDSKVHGVNMGPLWGRQDPCGPHVSPMNFAIWVVPNPKSYRKWFRLGNVKVTLLNFTPFCLKCLLFIHSDIDITGLTRIDFHVIWNHV